MDNRMCAYDPEMVNAIHNTVVPWEEAHVNRDDLVFWSDGIYYRLRLRLSEEAPLLQRVCPPWIVMQRVSM